MAAVLAIDFGTRRIGLAVTDQERRYVFPRDTLSRTDLQSDLDALGKRCAEVGVELLVVGLPLNVDGSEGPMTAAVRVFAGQLSERTGLPVEFADERYSSQEADEILRESTGRDTRRRRALRDKAAAAIILRTFLEHGPYPG